MGLELARLPQLFHDLIVHRDVLIVQVQRTSRSLHSLLLISFGMLLELSSGTVKHLHLEFLKSLEVRLPPLSALFSLYLFYLLACQQVIFIPSNVVKVVLYCQVRPGPHLEKLTVFEEGRSLGSIHLHEVHINVLPGLFGGEATVDWTWS